MEILPDILPLKVAVYLWISAVCCCIWQYTIAWTSECLLTNDDQISQYYHSFKNTGRPAVNCQQVASWVCSIGLFATTEEMLLRMCWAMPCGIEEAKTNPTTRFSGPVANHDELTMI